MQVAKADLVHIKNYIEQDSYFYANKTINKINEKISNLLIFPYMGRSVPEFDSQILRELIYKSYRIIYYLNSDTIYILKILHHSQDIFKFKSDLFQ
ncbi:MAG: type II toxin-antitoxin system RelE/ParE family toxin [Clostridia bacterium]|nr:type II toxin-antitoxin system RelE/ParE family toxin [Clostridia bacterium]